jgi:MFS family permease
LIGGAFMVTWTTLFLYFVFVGMLVPTLPAFVEDGLGGGEAAIGATLVTFSIAAVAFRPIITWIGDRYGRRALMVFGGAVATVATFGLMASDALWQVLVIRAVMGIAEAATFVGAQTLASDLSPPHRRAESSSYLSAAVFGGIAVGPVVGELALGDDRFVVAFGLAALCTAASAVVAMWAPDRVGPAPDAALVARPQAVWIHRAALFPGIVMALGIAGWSAFNAFVPTYVDDVGMSGAAGVFAVYSVLCFVLRIVAARIPDRIGLSRAVGLALWLVAAGLGVLALVPHAAGVYGATVLIALGVTFFYPSLLAASVNAVPESERVGVISSFSMFFEIGTAAGGLALGVVGEMTGRRGAFAGGAVFALVGVVVLRVAMSRLTRPQPV